MRLAYYEEEELSAFSIRKSSKLRVSRALSTVIPMRSISDGVNLKYESSCASAIFHSSIRAEGAVASVLASMLH